MSSEINQPVDRPMRPAWMEVDLGRLAVNFRLIHEDAPSEQEIGSEEKYNATGRGALDEENERFREYAKLRLRLFAHYDGRIAVSVQSAT